MLNIEISPKIDSLLMDESSQHKKRKLNNQDNATKSFEIASELIESGDSAQLREMLANGELSEINMENGVGRRLLIVASVSGQLVCLRVLLDRLESLSTESVDEIEEQDYQLINAKILVKRKAATAFVDNMTLLLVPCRRHYSFDYRYDDSGIHDVIDPDEPLTEYMFAHGVNVLVQACEFLSIDYPLVKALIAAGVDSTCVDGKGEHAIINACRTRSTKLVKLLLDHGAAVNAHYTLDYYDFSHESLEGEGRLLQLVCPDNLPMMEVLLEYGADANLFDKDGCSLFMLVFCNEYGHDEAALDLLLDHGVDLDVLSNNRGRRMTPLMEACRCCYDVEMVQRLLVYGADPNVTDDEGNTAPLYVKGRGELPGDTYTWDPEPEEMQYVNLLLSHGANPTIGNNDGYTIFDYVKPGSELEVLLKAHLPDRKPLLK